MRGAATPNCYTLALSHLEPGRAPTASMPAAARPHCILHAGDLVMLALFLAVQLVGLFNYYCRIVQNFPFKFGLRRSPR
jgi:hypothetical protein